MPCKNYCPSGAEAADYMVKLSMSRYPNIPGKNFRRTHKPLEVEAVADSQADHRSRPGTTAEAAEGSNLDHLDQAVPLMTDTLISDTTTSTESRTLRGIILLLLWLTVVIFVGHEDDGEGKRGEP
jgi:hypothetical protein